MPGNALPHGAAPGARRSPPALGSALVRTWRPDGFPQDACHRQHAGVNLRLLDDGDRGRAPAAVIGRQARVRGDPGT
jgi:hypothetical protein